MTPINANMTARDWGLLTLLSILWGGSFFFVELAVVELPVFTVVLIRVGLAALALHAVLLASGRPLGGKARVLGAFFIMGCINNVVPFTLLVWGQAQIASGLAAILNATTPLFTVLLAHVLTVDERLTGPKVAGVLCGFAGVAIMIGGSALDGVRDNLAAQMACLGAAVSYGFAGLYGRRFARMGIAPMHTATGQVSASAVILLPLVLWIDRPWLLPFPGLAVIASLVALALLSTALAYIIYFRILRSSGATNLLLVTFLVPVSAILLGVAFLGEVLLPRHLIGMAGIAAGLALIDGRLVRRVLG